MNGETNVIVTDAGFGPDDWNGGFVPLADWTPEGGAGLDLLPADDPAALRPCLEDVPAIRVAFPAFSDGRGFTIARRLRLMGYGGRLRAFGHLIADQYAMARRSGFDEVEIAPELARRQPQDQWLRRADWRAHDYQSRLRA
ncbi:MAG: DUF934 domain-containing protein [Tranquillimonas sp.]